MTFWGFDFRRTAGFVTDPAGCSGVLLNTQYPIVYSNGLTAGWATNGTIVQYRDRDASLDPRIAGCNFQSNSGTQDTFQIDLPAAGTYDLAAAIGDASSASAQYVEFFDGTTSLLAFAGTAVASGSFLDPTGHIYTAANWPGSNTTLPITLAGTTLTVVIGSASAQSGTTTLAHVGLTSSGGGGTVGRLVGGTLCGGVLVSGLLTGF